MQKSTIIYSRGKEETEDPLLMQHRLNDFDLEGKVNFEGGRNDRSPTQLRVNGWVIGPHELNLVGHACEVDCK